MQDLTHAVSDGQPGAKSNAIEKRRSAALSETHVR